MDCREFFYLFKALQLFGMLYEHIVEFGNKTLHRGDKLNQAFGHEHSAEVPAKFRTLCHDVAYLAYDIIESHALGGHFFRDDAYVGLCLEGALKCYVRGRTSHQFDEVIVFLG